MFQDEQSLVLRPYELMCIVCRIGAGRTSDLKEERLNDILSRIRENPRIPVTLRCNVDSIFAFQNPGTAEDTPEGELFNVKRDLDILQKLGLVPGSTRPADEIFLRLFESIPTARGICGYADATSETWRGCPLAESGHYEKGHAKGVEAVIPPRGREEKSRAKNESAAAMYEAKGLRIRPHHLMCMACFHAGKETLAPIQEDNLFEAIDIIQKDPEIPVTLVAGCCQICPPCSKYDPKTNWCVYKIGAGLRDEKKDLDVLQLLGLKYGDTLPARELYRLLFERIPSTRLICGYSDGVIRGREWIICGDPEGDERYAKARQARLGIPGL